ncbi:MAG: hypothetical protein ACYDCC_04915 [Actinomycetota bacterium]
MHISTKSRFIATPLVLLAALVFAVPRSAISITAAQKIASLARLDVNATPAGLPVALAPLAYGASPSRASVARANTAETVSGTSGALSRLTISIPDVNGDSSRDLFDIRANGGTLSFQVIDGGTGRTVWTGTPIVRGSDVTASLFVGDVSSTPSVYLLESYQLNSYMNWSLHKINAVSGAIVWTQSGSIPLGLPAISTPSVPPSVPPSIPPSAPSIPALPSVPFVPGVPSVPTAPPSIPGTPSIPSCVTDPTGVLSSNVPTCIPTAATPTGLPVSPSIPAVCAPSPIAGSIPTNDPTCLPTSLGAPTGLPVSPPSSPLPDACAPSPVASAIQSVAPTCVPTDVPPTVPSVPSGAPTAVPAPPSASPLPAECAPSQVAGSIPSPAPTCVPTGVPGPAQVQKLVPTPFCTSVPATYATNKITECVTTPAAPSSGRARASRASADTGVPIAAYVTGAAPVDVNGDGIDDFPLTQTVSLLLPDGTTTTVISELTTVSGVDGSLIGAATAYGYDAVPSVAVSGDFTGTGKLPHGILAVDETAKPDGSGSVVTYRGLTPQGAPVFAAEEQISPNMVSVYDASTAFASDGKADILANHFPAVPGSGQSQIELISGVALSNPPIGQLQSQEPVPTQQGTIWSQSFDEVALAYVSHDLVNAHGPAIVTQGLHFSQTGLTPDSVVYRGFDSAGTQVYDQTYQVASGAQSGNWFAILTSNAGLIDSDNVPDLMHEVQAIPSGNAPVLWSSAAVSGVNGGNIWSIDGPLNPGAPVGGSIAGDHARDLVEVEETHTAHTDGLIIKTTMGATGVHDYVARVRVGDGFERVRSVDVQVLDPGASQSDLVLTIVQSIRNSTATRSLVILVHGSNGRVRWIRTI